MPMINTFGVIGGDERMKYLAQSIAADGYPVCVCGLEKLGTCRGAAECDLPQLAAKSSVILLPLPATKDGLFLNAPYAENEIRLDDDFARLFMHKTVCGGMLQRLTASSSLWREIEPEDYYRREELAVGNAIPTAEGAVGIAIREYPGTINGAKCLITGFGRIGKNLAIILRGMGAEVFCAARKKADLMQMRAFGVQPLTYREISRRFDLIFNTVPAKVLTSPVLMQQTRDTLIIELASAPGGIDLKRAEELHLHVIDAPSLPGRVAPKTAAEYIKEAGLQYFGGVVIDMPTLAFAMCGSFCTFEKALAQLALLRKDWDMLPVMSETAYTTDTRFGTAESFHERIENICGRKIIHTIAEAEPIGPKRLADAVLVAPCTGNTAAKIANAVTDTAVTMAVKSALRVSMPVILSLATNDALGASCKNIGLLMNTKNIYFVPLGQDDPIKKPNSLVAHFDLIPETLANAVLGEQLQPVLR